MWALLGFASAMLLGVYDVFKKLSLKGNAVIPVLFGSTLTGALLFLPVLAGSKLGFVSPTNTLFYVPPVNSMVHGLIFIKSVIVTVSWIFSYFAMKHLPITIVTPVRATGPLWTLLGAIVLFSEELTFLQWGGIAVTLTFFYLFSLTGKTEGIDFTRNKWIGFVIVGTLTGACSGLYDKFLLQEVPRMAVQVYFPLYQVALLSFVLLYWLKTRKFDNTFEWRWSIPFIGLFLIMADFLYFYALTDTDSLISVLSSIRRGGVVIAFIIGAIVFKEKNIKRKALYLLGILGGILLLLLGSR